ncbi:M55 family metallopeptidase, partial [Nonomuraea fuscirosea]
MKVYLSVDMEGVTGLTDPEEMHAGKRGYERGCELMTADANAAIEGAFAAGADEVLVNDAHGSTKNLRIDLLDPRSSLIRGPGKAQRMAQGLDGTFGAACFVGYHARAGVPDGVLNHTWMGKEIQNVYLNGELCGETRLVAACAGFHGVPVVLVTGDEAVGEEARELLGDVETVAVKRGIDKFSAELLPPVVTQARIREAASRALGRVWGITPDHPAGPGTRGVV